MASKESSEVDTGNNRLDTYKTASNNDSSNGWSDSTQVSGGESPRFYSEEGVTIVRGDVRDAYESWEEPTTIVSDGAYGTGSFPGEPSSTDDLREWYEPHVASWSEHASPETTLWFWNTEQGWAEIHGLLKEYGWEYRGANVWDKGLAHIAGNSNTETLRKFPQVTEMCVQYVRSHEAVLELDEKQVSAQTWLREEWQRAGLAFDEANDACGVVDAASRKYLSDGNDWYFPPPERFEQLRDYANAHGDPSGRPYLTPETEEFDPDDLEQSAASVVHRSKFDCPTGVTNVWSHPQVSGAERVTNSDGGALHPNQKPLPLVRQILNASTERGDVVWEPFGGLCTAAVAAKELDRRVYAAELVEEYLDAAVSRVQTVTRGERAGENGQAALSSFT